MNKILPTLLGLFLIIFVSLSIYVVYLKNTINNLQIENINLQIQQQIKDKTIQEIHRRNDIVLNNQKQKQELKEMVKIKEDNNKDLESKIESLFK